MGYNARNDEIRDNADAPRVGGTTRGIGHRPPFQCNTFRKGLRLVLAEDRG